MVDDIFEEIDNIDLNEYKQSDTLDYINDIKCVSQPNNTVSYP